MIRKLKTRYDVYLQRVLGSLTEIERRDVRAFDLWFYASGGWRWLLGVVAVTTLVAWIASELPWNMTFAEAALLFNVVVLTLIWSGLSAWFGHRRFRGRIFRFTVLAPLLALGGALAGASIAGLVQGVDPLAYLNDSAKVRHVVIAGMVFGFITDVARPVVYVGETQVMTQVGTLPIAFEIPAKTLEDAAKQFGPLAKEAIERTMKELQELRRQAASSIVVPQGGMPPAGGMGGLGGGKIQMP